MQKENNRKQNKSRLPLELFHSFFSCFLRTSNFPACQSAGRELRTSRFARGFTVLFAVLIGSLLFSIGLAIAHLSLKEIVLSAAGKQSETAFFAADTGIECALYWDIKVGFGDGETVFPASAAQTGYDSIECNGDSNIPVSLVTESATAATSTFTVNFFSVGAAPTSCAQVLVGKTLSGSTIIESRGRNDPDAECDNSIRNPATVERALRVRY